MKTQRQMKFALQVRIENIAGTIRGHITKTAANYYRHDAKGAIAFAESCQIINMREANTLRKIIGDAWVWQGFDLTGKDRAVRHGTFTKGGDK